MFACIAALTLLAPLTWEQDDWVYQGMIESKEVQIPHREGNVVVGTEFVHFEYRVSLKTVETSDVQEDTDGGPLRCIQECLGKVHKRHADCTPGTCDRQCTKRHERKMKGSYTPLRDNMAEATKDSARIARSLGMPGGSDNWSSYASNALKQLKEDAERPRTVRMGHSTQACGVLLGWHGRARWELHVKGEFRKVGYYMSRGVKTPIDEPAGSHEKKIAEAWIPKPDPVRTEDGYICHCFIPDNPKVPDPVDPPRETSIGRTPTYSGLGWRKPDGTLVIPDDKQVSIKTSGDGINYCNIEIQNKTGEDLICEAQPGTVASPNDGGVQIMIFMVWVVVVIPADSTTTLEVKLDNGELTAKGNMRVRVACTEMKKHPPTEATKFTFKPTEDDVFLGLTSRTARALNRGAWDQARIWIYTDHATIQEVNEKLSPPVTLGQYLHELHNVEAAGADLTGPEYKRCFDPALIEGSSAPFPEIEWFIHRVSAINSKGLVDTVKSRQKSWTGLLADNPSDGLFRYFATIIKALVEDEQPQVRSTGLQMLAEWVPTEKRSAFAAAGVLDTLDLALYSKKQDEVIAALKILALYKPEDRRGAVEYFVEHGASNAIKSEAAKTLAAYGPG